MGAARRALAALVLVAGVAAALVAAEPYGLPLEGAEAEAFLRSAAVIHSMTLPTGITRSQRLTLTDGEHTLRAIWKTIDVYRQVMRFADGTTEMGFQDSYKCELAAYELDKLLGVGLVPPVVERRIGRDRGSLQLWVEGAMMETERLEKGLKVKDPELWKRQIAKVRLFHNLTYNTDHRNVSNILSDPDSRLYLIDHSRTFRTRKELLAAGELTRFSASLLGRLRALDRKALTKSVGRWLSKAQIEALLARRDLVLERADRLIAERGEAEVLYP